MSDSYKHSYKVGEDLLNSLSVYNVGYQKCEPEYQWGPGVRDHYCIHHVLSGSGYYSYGDNVWRLEAGDTFIIFPGEEVEYYADRNEPWEYAWAGFMGTDAGSIIRSTEFTRETPYIRKGKIPGDKIKTGLEHIYEVKGNTYEATVAMAGALYSLLAVFMHYSGREEQEKDAQMIYVERQRHISEQIIPIRSLLRTWPPMWESAGVIFSALFRHTGINPRKSTCRNTGSSRPAIS